MSNEKKSPPMSGPVNQKKEDPKNNPVNDQAIFNIQTGFENYLKNCGYKAEEISEKMYKIMRHAYFGGCAQFYVLLAMEIPALKTEEHKKKAVDFLANLLNDYGSNNKDLPIVKKEDLENPDLKKA